MKTPVSKKAVEDLPGPEQLTLPDELVETPRAHTLGKRCLHPKFFGRMTFKNVELIHSRARVFSVQSLLFAAPWRKAEDLLKENKSILTRY
jgi:hypothetical protein